jgi:hypothetical protein
MFTLLFTTVYTTTMSAFRRNNTKGTGDHDEHRFVDTTPVIVATQYVIDAIFAVLRKFLDDEDNRSIVLGVGNIRDGMKSLSHALRAMFKNGDVTMYALVRKLGAHMHPDLVGEFFVELSCYDDYFSELTTTDSKGNRFLKKVYKDAADRGAASNRMHRENNQGMTSFNKLFPRLGVDATPTHTPTQQKGYTLNPVEFPALSGVVATPTPVVVPTPTPTPVVATAPTPAPVVVPTPTPTPVVATATTPVVVPATATTPVVVPATATTPVVVPEQHNESPPALIDTLGYSVCAFLRKCMVNCEPTFNEVKQVTASTTPDEMNTTLESILGREPTYPEVMDAIAILTTRI